MSNKLTPITCSNISTVLTQVIEYVAQSNAIPELVTIERMQDGSAYNVIESVEQLPLTTKSAVAAWVDHIATEIHPECIYPIATTISNQAYSLIFNRYTGQLIRLTNTSSEGEVIVLYQFGDKDILFTYQIAISLFESHQKLKNHLIKHMSFKQSLNLDSRHAR